MSKIAAGTMTTSVKSSTKKLTGMAMMVALSIIFLLVIPKFPIFPAAPYLVYDMADVPIILSGFMFGPGAGLLVLAAVSLLQGLLLSSDGLVGALMHFLSSGTLVLVSYYVAAKVGHMLGENKGMVIGLLCGSLAMTAVMIPLNLIITVHVYGQPQDVVVAALIPAIIPFNFIKAALNSAIFFICYKLLAAARPGLVSKGRE